MKDLRKKLKQLDAIEAAADGVQEGGSTPLKSAAACIGYIATITLMVSLFDNSFSLPISPSQIPALTVFALFVLLICCLVCGPLSKSWLEHLDELINTYNPLDEREYMTLQQDAKDARKLEPARVKLWVAAERDFVEKRIGMPVMPTGPGTKFINRNLEKA